MSDPRVDRLKLAAEAYDLGRAGATARANRLSDAADVVGGLNGVPGVETWRRRSAQDMADEAERQRLFAEACRAGAEALSVLAELRLGKSRRFGLGDAVVRIDMIPEVVGRAVALVADVPVDPVDFDARIAAHRKRVAEDVADGEFEQD